MNTTHKDFKDMGRDMAKRVREILNAVEVGVMRFRENEDMKTWKSVAERNAFYKERGFGSMAQPTLPKVPSASFTLDIG